MRKTVVIHQPDFSPYIGFFHRFLESDLYIVLDHVQFVKGTSQAWTNRDKFKSPSGERWLTVGTRKTKLRTPINEVLLSDEQPWRTNHLNQLVSFYRRAPYFEEVYEKLEVLYKIDCQYLYEFNLKSIEIIADMLNVRIPYVLSSKLEPEGTKNDLLVNLLSKVGATHYVSGEGARGYFDPNPFDKANINVLWQKFKHPTYPQLHGDFVPYLSTFDMLFNCGSENSRIILRSI